MKKIKRVHITYNCEYCRNTYYTKEKAIECEASHTPVGVGSNVEYTGESYQSEHGRAYPERTTYRTSGTIIKEKKGKFLIEHNSGSREWIYTWEAYR